MPADSNFPCSAPRVSFEKGVGVVPGTAATKAAESRSSGRCDWKVGLRYQVRARLGSGAYGCVCEAHDLQAGRRVAIKRTRAIFENVVTCRRIVREVCILTMLQKHENIVQVLDLVAPVGKDGRFDEIYMVMEVCDSDLRRLIKKDICLDPRQLKKILYTLLNGLKYLHSGGIWHRDLKPANVLLNEDCTAKICDFGLARAAGDWVSKVKGSTPADRANRLLDPKQSQSRQLSSHVCTRWYRAPELILLQESYTEAVDLWSVGCIFGELLELLGTSKARDRRGPLFPGDACYPLSPDREPSDPGRRTKTVQARDQLEMIFNTIGTPTAEEVELLDHDMAKRYVRLFPARIGSGFLFKVPEADERARDLLGRTLRFDPARRASASELLEHRFFADVRRRSTETTAPGILRLRFDEEPDDLERLRTFLLREVTAFQPPKEATATAKARVAFMGGA